MRKILAALLPLCSLLSDEGASTGEPQTPESPWLMGPLLASPGTVTPVGHFVIQPYVFYNVSTGVYDSDWKSHDTPNFYNTNVELFVVVGLTKWMDFQVLPQVYFNRTQGHSSAHFADFITGFDIQLLDPERFKTFPGIKLGLFETFPTGKYQKLNPNKKGSDFSGFGSYITGIQLVFYKLIHFTGHHYLSITLDGEYAIPSAVHVEGFNIYGGGFGAHGTVHPGKIFTAFLSFEYSFTKHWVFCLDNVYNHVNKDRFTGHPGFLADGVPSHVGRLSSDLLSFCPGIEYNFNANWGISSGVWFSAMGRNIPRFVNGVLTVEYQY